MHGWTEWNAYNPMGVTDMLFGKDMPQEEFSQKHTSGMLIIMIHELGFVSIR